MNSRFFDVLLDKAVCKISLYIQQLVCIVSTMSCVLSILLSLKMTLPGKLIFKHTSLKMNSTNKHISKLIKRKAHHPNLFSIETKSPIQTGLLHQVRKWYVC